MIIRSNNLSNKRAKVSTRILTTLSLIQIFTRNQMESPSTRCSTRTTSIRLNKTNNSSYSEPEIMTLPSPSTSRRNSPSQSPRASSSSASISSPSTKTQSSSTVSREVKKLPKGSSISPSSSSSTATITAASPPRSSTRR